MSKETLVGELTRLERSISDYDREALLVELRGYTTDTDEDRSTYRGWKRGNVYFHSLEDMMLARTVYNDDTLYRKLPNSIKSSQACFAKDLDLYLDVFPSTESQEIRELFQLIFNVGTSAYWDQDRELVTELYRIYQTLDREVIRPWADEK